MKWNFKKRKYIISNVMVLYVILMLTAVEGAAATALGAAMKFAINFISSNFKLFVLNFLLFCLLFRSAKIFKCNRYVFYIFSSYCQTFILRWICTTLLERQTVSVEHICFSSAWNSDRPSVVSMACCCFDAWI